MEPTSTPASLSHDAEAVLARINQKRRQRSASSTTRSVPTTGGPVDVRVDAPQAKVPAPFTRAQRLQSFVEQLRSSNQTAVAQTANLRSTATTEIVNRAALLKARSKRPDFSSPAGQAAEQKANQEIANAIEALDASRKKYADLVAEKKLLPEHEVVAHSSAMASTKDDLVASISAAIATVLTDVKLEANTEPMNHSQADVAFAEPAVESVPPAPMPQPIVKKPVAKKTILQNAVVQPPAARPVVKNSIAKPAPAPAPAKPKKPKPDTLEVVDSDVLNVGAFIPVDVAAWDVEKFIWPMIVDQFLDIGEQAISRLANFSLDILDGSQHRLAVTSMRSGAGASTIACAVARWSAQMKKRVLLVDANLSSPSLAGSIGLAPNISWINAVRESLNASEAIIRSKSTGICVMPLGEISDRTNLPSMLLDQLGELLRTVEHSFDLIVLDTGEAGKLPTELSVSRNLVDAAMIVDSNVASQSFRQTKDNLLKFGITKFVAAQNSI